jgi:hypothetical protein
MAEEKWTEVPVEHSGEKWTEIPLEGKPAEPKYNAAQSAVMHGIQGLTGHLSDEIAGAGEAAGRALGVNGVGGPMKDMGLAPDGPTLDWETLRDAYRMARDKERAALKQQSVEHPMASDLAEFAGTVASPINKVAKGMSLARGGATLGGVNAFGSSEAPDAGGVIGDTALGVTVGGLTGGLLDKAKGLAPSMKNVIDDVATAPLGQEGERGLVASGLDKIHQVGVAGNNAVDSAVSSLPKGARSAARVVTGKATGTMNVLEHAPKAAQWAAGKASGAIDKASQFLLRSPRMQQLANANPTAFKALAAHLAQKTSTEAPQAKENFVSQPVDEETAKNQFLEGN